MSRATTVAATLDEVWPWLVQVGCLRGGWYSNDLLDNLGHPGATEILPELQRLELGQWIPMAPTPTEKTAFKVAAAPSGSTPRSTESPRTDLWHTGSRQCP